MSVDADVLALVERALKKDPTLSSGELQERVAKKHKNVAGLTTRQFHARYALQAKKRLGGGGGGSRRRKARKRRGATRKVSRRQKASTGQKASRRQGTDPVRDLLREQYDERRAALDAAMDDAFERSMRADSLAGVNELLAAIDRQIAELGR